jgi:A/G-specific adenine glycosylase
MYSTLEITAVRQLIWDYYHDHGRELPWREPPFDPYRILVSEIMLQQTQVSRIIPKYTLFLERFPSVESLAAAPLRDVLELWSGLGYNRRARFLQAAAQMVKAEFGGRFPKTTEELVHLPGVGRNTAGAILAYAYNQPVVFVETNIRTVIIQHFFAGQEKVSDKEVLAVMGELLDHEHPREFYWAMMDYGSYSKQTHGNAGRASKHYVKQSIFKGSKRQLRGQVLRLLTAQDMRLTELQTAINNERLAVVLDDLQKEGLIAQRGKGYTIA